jgi:poly(A) polymerase
LEATHIISEKEKNGIRDVWTGFGRRYPFLFSPMGRKLFLQRMEDFIDISEDLLRRIGALADQAGVDAVVVGGYVRDLLISRPTKDIDISVVGDGPAFAQRVAEAFGIRTVVLFEKFGTAHFAVDGRVIEFVGTRKESYDEHSRKPRVAIGTLMDDLRRRDFTVNAMAVSLNADRYGRIIDPFDGRQALRDRVLDTPLDPVTTFSEDPLRIMRAFRFVAQLGFVMAPRIPEAIRELHERIAIVSMERVRDEFLKILETPRPSLGLAPMLETGVLQHVLPELHALAGTDQRQVAFPDGAKSYHHKDVFYHTLRVLDNLCEVSDNLWLRMAALLHDIAKPRTKAFRDDIGWTFHGHAEVGARMAKKIFKDLKLPLDPFPFVRKMVSLHLRPMALVDEGVTDSAIRRLLFEAGEDIDSLILLVRADITSKNKNLVRKYLANYEMLVEKMRDVEARDRLRNWQPPLSGDEIMRVCLLQPGIVVGVLKSRIENAILDGVIPNDHDAALRYLLDIKDDILDQPVLTKTPSRKHVLKNLPDRLTS